MTYTFYFECNIGYNNSHFTQSGEKHIFIGFTNDANIADLLNPTKQFLNTTV